jgi:hypothetical protein
MHAVEVEIFGRRFRLRSDDPEKTTRVADEIKSPDKRTEQPYDNLDFTKLLLLICLQQQEQVIDLGDRNSGTRNRAGTMNQMISRIIS